jgi:lipocalin
MMSMKFILASFLSGASATDFGPVSELQTAAYLGRWYQTYASSTVKYTFEAGGDCVTADYGAVQGRDDVITVTNRNLALGLPVSISGYGVANPNQVGEFQVNLGPFANPAKPNPYSSTNYLVFGLGPIVDGKYDYALVSEPKKVSLYVLVRDVSRFRTKYETDVLKQLETLGFTSALNKPLSTKQDGCSYSDSIVSQTDLNVNDGFGPVSDLQATAYLGRWYQTYASSTVKNTFEAGGNCVTADYGAVEGRSDVITVKNSNLALGLPVSISGYAIANPSQAGEFQVNLGPFANPSKPSAYSTTNYLVFGLGPIVDGKYDYALVSDPKQATLYVLVRDVDRFKKQYESDVLDSLTKLGFTSASNKPLATRQDGCKYNTAAILV